jgi:hypothetical protein
MIDEGQNHRPPAKVLLETRRSSRLVAKLKVQRHLSSQSLFQLDASKRDRPLVVGR